MRVGVLGAGRAGSFFARGISARRGTVILDGVFARKKSAASRLVRACRQGKAWSSIEDLIRRADSIIICVPDSELSGVANDLARLPGLRGKVFLHCSGIHGLKPLASLKSRGCHTGRLHPLAALPPANTRESEMSAIWYSLEGNPRAEAATKRLVKHLRGNIFTIPGLTKESYHLAATMIANHTTVLASLAFNLMTSGKERKETASMRRAFGGLIRSVARRVEKAGPLRALTGPAARGDRETLESHLALLQADDEFTRIYSLLSIQAVRMSRNRGSLATGQADGLETVLKRSSRRRR
jgi:predicted short-subunit dehydrogenase-like oxidoreductase (DUF2520 family)